MTSFSHKIAVSSNTFGMTLFAYTKLKDALVKEYGEKAIVVLGIDQKPSQSGLYFANFYLNIQPNEPAKPKIILTEVKEDANYR
jgi:hypothetical protein